MIHKLIIVNCSFHNEYMDYNIAMNLTSTYNCMSIKIIFQNTYMKPTKITTVYK